MATSATSIFMGRGSILGLALETTYDTAVNPTVALKVISATVLVERPQIPRPHLHGGVGNVAEGYFDERQDVTIDCEVELGYDSMLLLLRAAMGPAPSTTGAGPYVHPLLLGSELPSLTLRLHKGTATGSLTGRYMQISGAIINTATITITAGALPRMSFQAFGKSFTSGDQGSLTVKDTTPVLYHQAGNLSWNSGTYDCNAFTLSINNGIARRRNVGGLSTLYPHPSTQREIICSIGRDHVDDDFLVAVLAATESDLAVTFTGASPNVMEIVVHKARLNGTDSFAVSEGGFGAIGRTFDFIPRNDRSGTDYGLEVTVTNGNASYLT